MLRKISLIVCLGIISIGLHAQYVFDQGSIAVNAGIGFISMDGKAPSLNISGEIGLFPTGEVGVISLGGAMEYKYSTITNGAYYNQATLGPRVSWHIHLPFLERINSDFYAGIGAGLHHCREQNTVQTEIFDRKISPYFEAYIGGRLKLNNNIDLFVEYGEGAIASVKAGFCYQLKRRLEKNRY